VGERKESIQMANLIKTIQAEGTFTAFSRALEMTELVTVLREPGAYTVFAPTDRTLFSAGGRL